MDHSKNSSGVNQFAGKFITANMHLATSPEERMGFSIIFGFCIGQFVTFGRSPGAIDRQHLRQCATGLFTKLHPFLTDKFIDTVVAQVESFIKATPELETYMKEHRKIYMGGKYSGTTLH